MKNENLTLLATKLNNADAEAFRKLAEKNGTTVSRMLSTYIKDAVHEDVNEPNPSGTNVAVLTYKNVDRLKHEVAFHNPNHMDPNGMLNHILNQYFKMVAEVRKTTK